MKTDIAKHKSGKADRRDNRVDVDILDKKTILTRLKTLLTYANKQEKS